MIKMAESKTFKLYAIIVLLIVAVVIFLQPAACRTESCFLDKANSCSAATYTNIINGTTLFYEVNNCVLKKTVVALSPEEMPEVIERFLGKSMVCLYAKDDFSPLHIYTLSGMLNTCEGDLKAAIIPYTLAAENMLPLNTQV
ncbi:hypothetical protein KY310_04200 [Candidatus Woesearchaeota archaeon]|nr:hypothetical protein [Candidatus Woesearchaeota archaeon]